MDEIVVRLARALASPERLRILSRLAAAGEISPTQLGREIHMRLNALSGHLAKLAHVGLVKRRRSGGRSYCVADSPYSLSTLSGMAHAWLRKLLSDPRRVPGSRGPHEGRRLSAEEAQTRVHQLVFESATAFTDLRRLQILRHLAGGREAAAEALCKDLSMSVAAVSRQTQKLIRRGYLSARRDGLRAFYRLSPKFKTPVHARLFGIVRSTWAERPFRTS